jgi:hypothetical protein
VGSPLDLKEIFGMLYRRGAMLAHLHLLSSALTDSYHLCFSICPYCRKFDFKLPSVKVPKWQVAPTTWFQHVSTAEKCDQPTSPTVRHSAPQRQDENGVVTFAEFKNVLRDFNLNSSCWVVIVVIVLSFFYLQYDSFCLFRMLFLFKKQKVMAITMQLYQ